MLGNLREVALPSGTVIEYVIDGLSRRIGRKVNGALVQGLLYQSRLKPVAELDGSANVVARFIYTTRVNMPDYMIKGGATYRILTDQLGSPRLVIDTATGAIVQRMDYDEFGGVTLDTNPGFQPFGFAGGLYDRDTGLVRFGARDYDPEVGRFTRSEPLMKNPAAIQRYARLGVPMSPYGYAANNPLFYFDPTALGVLVISFDLSAIFGGGMSGGGGSWGLSLVFYENGLGDIGLYWYSHTSADSQGLSFGASVQIAIGFGEGSYDGVFDNEGFNVGPVCGGSFQSPLTTPANAPRWNWLDGPDPYQKLDGFF